MHVFLCLIILRPTHLLTPTNFTIGIQFASVLLCEKCVVNAAKTHKKLKRPPNIWCRLIIFHYRTLKGLVYICCSVSYPNLRSTKSHRQRTLFADIVYISGWLSRVVKRFDRNLDEQGDREQQVSFVCVCVDVHLSNKNQRVLDTEKLESVKRK